MLETAGNVAGTRHAIALKPRENYCNLERLHNRNQPFLRVYRNFISLHLNYVVQWLCKYMLNCQPIIDYQLVRRYILLSDAEINFRNQKQAIYNLKNCNVLKISAEQK